MIAGKYKLILKILPRCSRVVARINIVILRFVMLKELVCEKALVAANNPFANSTRVQRVSDLEVAIGFVANETTGRNRNHNIRIVMR